MYSTHHTKRRSTHTTHKQTQIPRTQQQYNRNNITQQTHFKHNMRNKKYEHNTQTTTTNNNLTTKQEQ